MFTVEDTVIDLVYAVWEGSLAVSDTPSFLYVVQNQGSDMSPYSYTGAIKIGNAQDSGLSASNGHYLAMGDTFHITLPQGYRLGLIAAETSTPAAVNVTMVTV
jgi:hypothetical protein